MAKRTPREPLSDAHVQFGRFVETIRESYPLSRKEAHYHETVWSGLESGKEHPTEGHIRYILTLCKTEDQKAQLLDAYHALGKKPRKERPSTNGLDRAHIFIKEKLGTENYEALASHTRKYPILPWIIVAGMVLVLIAMFGWFWGLQLFWAMNEQPSIFDILIGIVGYLLGGMLSALGAFGLVVYALYRLQRRAAARLKAAGINREQRQS